MGLAAITYTLSYARTVRRMVEQPDILPSDRKKPPIKRRIEEDDEYFRGMTRQWGKILNDGVISLPEPPWLNGDKVSHKIRTS